MKTLIICGDSYMSPSLLYPKTHFTEIFAEKLNFNLIAYARQGISNTGIALQVMQAIQDKPDLIILNTTYPSRIEFNIDPDDGLDKELTDFARLQDIGYLYYEPKEVSAEMYLNNKAKFMCEPIYGLISTGDYQLQLIEKYRLSDVRAKVEAVKLYYKEIYNSRAKLFNDRMMMYGILYMLHKSGIKYLFTIDRILHNPYDYKPWDFTMDWIVNTKSDMRNYFIKILDEDKQGNHMPYHTTIETQDKIAHFLIEHYNKYFA